MVLSWNLKIKGSEDGSKKVKCLLYTKEENEFRIFSVRNAKVETKTSEK
jgi:hypothetical protein